MLCELLRAFCGACFCPLAGKSKTESEKQEVDCRTVQLRRSRSSLRNILQHDRPGAIYLVTSSTYHDSCRSLHGILKPPSPALIKNADEIVRPASPPESASSTQSIAQTSTAYKHVSWADLPEEENANQLAAYMKRSRSRSSERRHDGRSCSAERKPAKERRHNLEEEGQLTRDMSPARVRGGGRSRREMITPRHRPESLRLSRSNYHSPGMQAALRDGKLEVESQMSNDPLRQSHKQAASSPTSVMNLKNFKDTGKITRRSRSLDCVLENLSAGNTASSEGIDQEIQDGISSLASPHSIDIEGLNVTFQRIMKESAANAAGRSHPAATSSCTILLSHLRGNLAAANNTKAGKRGERTTTRPHSWSGAL